MILCLDVGNTQIFGGVHDGEKLVFNFRTTTSINRSSDETGIFLRNVLRENNIDHIEQVNHVIVVVKVILLHDQDFR